MSVSELNPYVAPESAVSTLPPLTHGEDQVWRRGKYLIFRKGASLPERCIKTNVPVQGPGLRRKVTWHHPAVFLALLANVIVYVIIALCMRKTAKVELPVSKSANRKRQLAVAITSLGIVGSFAAFIYGMVKDIPELGSLGVLGLLGFAIYGVIFARFVVARKITDDFVWLTGVSREYLAELPEFPHG